MKKLLLLGLLYSAAHANVSIQDTVLPKAITMQYECLARKNMLDKASAEFKEVYESIKAGKYTFHEDTLNKAIPNWKLMLHLTEPKLK